MISSMHCCARLLLVVSWGVVAAANAGPIFDSDAEPAMPRYRENLSSATRLPEARVRSGAAIDLVISLGKGWKLNAEAGSWLAVFRRREGGQEPEVVHAYSKKDLLGGKLRVAALVPGEYVAQGRLYYCQAAAVSACFATFYHRVLRAVKGGRRRVVVEIP